MSPKPKRKSRRKPPSKGISPLWFLGGAALVIFLGTVAYVYDAQQQEEAMPSVAPSPSVGPKAGTSPKPKHKPNPKPSLRPLPALQLGMNERVVRELLGKPDQDLGDGRYRYSALGLEVTFRSAGSVKKLLAEFHPDSPQDPFASSLGGESAASADALVPWKDEGKRGGTPFDPSQALPMERLLASVQITGEVPQGQFGGIDLSELHVGASPQVLRGLLPQGRLLYNRKTGVFTLYLPRRQLAIDFTAKGILGIRQSLTMAESFATASMVPYNLQGPFERVFQPEWFVPPRIEEKDLAIKVLPKPGKVPESQLELRLKVETFELEHLKELIQRQVKKRIAAGDGAVAVRGYALNGTALFVADWYAPDYPQRTGTDPVRCGDVDPLDGISYRWY